MKSPDIADLARMLDKLVVRLEKTEKPEISPFTKEEIDQIKRAAQLVEWFDTLGWMGKRLMGLIATVVVLISQWERIKEFFKGAGP